jgi:outer membrane protein insertion porin family
MKFRVFVFFWVVFVFFGAPLIFSQADADSSDGEQQQITQEADPEWYLGKPIRDIVFSGLKNISPSELDGLMNPFKGRIFTDAIFWEITGRLYALEYFDYIEPSTHRTSAAGNDVVIRFTVVERPVISRINFVGNSGLRRGELMDIISSKVTDVLNLAKVRADREAIINKYIEKGYPNVAVTTSEVASADGAVTLVFNITEGNKITITRIEFQGNSRFSNNTLRAQLSLKAKSLLNDGAFQEAKLLEDREAIVKYYNDRGFIDAAVRDVTRVLTEEGEGTSMVLTFLIDEGSEFKFGGISFEGNVIFSSEQLQRLVLSRVDDVINMTRLVNDLQRVADLYFENGYIFNSITHSSERNNQTNVISYKITIIERSRAYIENIIILGNEKTRSNVILREIPLEPGDVFSKAKVMQAMRNLYNLQYFSMIIPDTLQGSTEYLMDLVFNLEEQPTTDIQFGLTFTGSADPTTFPISGLFKWHDRNLLGTGNELGAELNSSVIDTTSFSLNYLQRWAFGLPLSLGMDFSVNHTSRLALNNSQAPFFYGTEPGAFPDGFQSYEEYINRSRTPTREYLMDYEQLYLSLGLSTGYRWSTFMGIFGINGGVRFGILRNSYDEEIFRPFDPVLREGNRTFIPKNSFWFALTLDQRDIFYDPSRGYYLQNRFGVFGFFNNEREHFFRNDTKAQYYLTLFNLPVSERWSFKCVFAIHAGLSFIARQPFRGDPTRAFVEDANKLAIDGMFIGRGWTGEFRDNRGLMLLDSWVELRFPLVPGLLALDLFFDMAGVEKDEGYYFGTGRDEKPNFTEEQLRFSFGGGLRFTIPQFPIRLSLAKCFQIKDGAVVWKQGNLFADPARPNSGIDLVVSFALSY